MIRIRTRAPSAVVRNAVVRGVLAVHLLASSAVLAQQAPPREELRLTLKRHVEAGDAESVAAYGPGVMPLLLDLYREADREERIGIANTLYRLGWRSEEAKELLTRDARSLNQDLRIQAQYALGRVSDDPAIIDLLIENLQKGFNPLVRDKAACGLAYDQIHLDDHQKARLLRKVIELLESPNAETRMLAIRVLHVHTGQTKGFVPALPESHRAVAVERWRRWIEEYEANL